MRCSAVTRRGEACSIELVTAEEIRLALCHVHNPAGVYQAQVRARRGRKGAKAKVPRASVGVSTRASAAVVQAGVPDDWHQWWCRGYDAGYLAGRAERMAER